MTERTPNSEWNEEYRLFVESKGSKPPGNLSMEIKKTIYVDLNPRNSLVFAKLFAIHFISGVFTLLVCPQFEVALFHGQKNLFRLFLMFGQYGCMLACGAFFVGMTGLISAVLLKPQEVRAIMRSRGLQWALLAFISVGFFLSFKEQEMSIPVGLVMAWVVGAIFGGSVSFRISSFFRNKVRAHLLLP